MRKSAIVTTFFAAAALALSGCSDSAAEAESAESSPDVTEVKEPVRSERGNLVHEVGDPVIFRAEEGGGEEVLKFTVTDIEVDPECPGPHAMPAVNGHLIAVSVEAETGADPQFRESLVNGASFESFNWKVISAEGKTENSTTSAATYACLNTGEVLPSHMGPGEKVKGKVVLDVPDDSGTLIYSVFNEGGWEWEFGAK